MTTLLLTIEVPDTAVVEPWVIGELVKRLAGALGGHVTRMHIKT